MPIGINGSGTITGISAGGLPDGTVTTDDIAAAAVTPAKLSQPLTLATAQNTTSGTSIDFTGIPSWVRRITLMLRDVSTNGTSNYLVQIGSGSVTTTGYVGSSMVASAGTGYTTGFGIRTGSTTDIICGTMQICLVSGTTWVANGLFGLNTAGVIYLNAGGVTLSGPLDRVRLTTVNGTDAFDAGSVNIMYEG